MFQHFLPLYFKQLSPRRPQSFAPHFEQLGLCADSVEKHEPASDIAIAVVDSLKAVDPNRPIREADMDWRHRDVRFVPIVLQKSLSAER